MAHKVCTLLSEDADKKDRYLLICGIGHMGYGYGVPERILAKHEDMAEQLYLIAAREPDHLLSLDK